MEDVSRLKIIFLKFFLILYFLVISPFEYTLSVCEDFEVIKSCFSDKIQTSFSNGKYHCKKILMF